MSAVESTEVPPGARTEPPPSMVERMTLILDAFRGPTARLSLEEVARTTHLPRSTAHRILDSLVKLSWLDHTAFGYALGRRALELSGGGDLGVGGLRAAAAQELHGLSVGTGMVVHLAVLEEGWIRYLDKMGGRFAAVVPSRVGGRAPAHCTALGKAMLAWLDPEQVDEHIGGSMTRATPRTIGDLSTLHQELHRVRTRGGLAFDRGELFPNISCVAAAVRGPDGPAGAISLVGEPGNALERFAPLVAGAARRVSLELFPDPERVPYSRGRVPPSRPATAASTLPA